MANFTLNLGSIDLTPYVRVDPGEGLDPAGDPLQPQFVDAPLGDGQPLGTLQASNREWVIPVHLHSTDKPTLHALVRSIRNTLDAKPVTLEWADVGATNSTFYDIEYGKFVVEFNFRRGAYNYISGTIHIWVRPYGHTGTTRIAGTAVASVNAALATVSMPSIAGDVRPLLDVTVSGGAGGLGGALTMIAVRPNASYAVEYRASQWIATPALNTNASMVSQSDAVGSTTLRLVFAGGTPGVSANNVWVDVKPLQAYAGRNRVFVVARASSAAHIIQFRDPNANLLLATGVASPGILYGAVDLGTFDVPTVALPVGTIKRMQLVVGRPASSAATSVLELTDLLIVPEGQTVLVNNTASKCNDVHFDGVNRRTYGVADPFAVGASLGFDLQSVQRASIDTLDLSVPSQAGLAIISLTPPASGNGFSTTIRVRERFTYAR